MLFVAAIRTDVSAHVLHDTQHRYLYLLEHLQTFAGIEQGDILGSGNNDCTGDRHLLCQSQLGVTRARRQIDHQIIKL